MKSLCGPSGKKAVTRNQFVFWLSPRPLFVPTEYLRISFPVLVGRSSGVSASLPTMVIFAKDDRSALLEKVRDKGAAVRSARRAKKEDILGL